VPNRGATASFNVLRAARSEAWAATRGLLLMPHVATGKVVKILGVASARRQPCCPQVFDDRRENGVRGFDLKIWFGVHATAQDGRGRGSPVCQGDRRTKSFAHKPDVKERIEKTGLAPLISTAPSSAPRSRRPRTLRQDSSATRTFKLRVPPRAGHHHWRRNRGTVQGR